MGYIVSCYNEFGLHAFSSELKELVNDNNVENSISAKFSTDILWVVVVNYRLLLSVVFLPSGVAFEVE